ncbi:hypothetical protein AG1IA_09711 [Rhizoctonia solani AG-1 IA]|uniref:Uncharacterized protein n=1 Tax=Thanatephorus cucumeris (strain AG1-IA) TaxID=983506 RepID=L8WIT2_THACA|nr:hypothetical protein AG1IA_09711 [Rhizoctonia solani AG-1 IA]
MFRGRKCATYYWPFDINLWSCPLIAFGSAVQGDQIRLLEYRWECARKKDRRDVEAQSDVQRVANHPKCDGRCGSKRDYIVAKVVGLSVPVVFR